MLSVYARPPARSGWASLFVLGMLLWSCVGTTDRGLKEDAHNPAGQTPGRGGQGRPPAAKPAVEALMINGGGSRSINYQSHLLHLKQMNRLLLDSGIPRDRITIMSADGSDPAADLAVQNERAEPGTSLLDGTDLEKFVRPRMQYENSKIDGATLRPATRVSLRRWFEQAAGRLHPGDTLLLYVTDHGTRNSADTRDNRITLWGRDEYLDVAELRRLLGRLQPGVRVVQLMSQCYSGSFANLMYPRADDPLPSGNVCGFFSSTAERPAYGCYPETVNKENVGHSFRFIQALADGYDFDDAHRQALVSDDSPDTPFRTSDIYLESLLREASRQRGVPPDGAIDELLYESWRDPGRWEPEIRLLDRISESYGYFSPRLLGELDWNSEALEKAGQAFGSYNKTWDETRRALNRDNLQRFLAGQPGWSGNAAKQALEKMDPGLANQFVRKLLPALDDYTRADGDTTRRLELLQQRTEDTAQARYRMEVRQAVVLRLRTLLTSIAGRLYLEKHGSAAQREAYQALVGCESFGLTDTRKSAPFDSVTQIFPSYDREVELAKEVAPGWIGVQYKPVSDAVRNRFQLGTGAAVVSVVDPDSPARTAGLQPGDIIVGQRGAPFDGGVRIREWVMTAPVGVPQVLQVLRGEYPFLASLTPVPEPVDLPDLSGPVKAGRMAPSLDRLRPYRGSIPGVGGGSYLLFFFATWCGPCKASLPQLAVFEREHNTPIIAVTDESAEKLDAFFQKYKGFFPSRVMRDDARQLFLAYGVNGIPTFVLVESGRVRSVTVGYNSSRGLRFE